MVTAILREASCERGGRAAILVQYDSIFIEIALLNLTALPSAVNRIHKLACSAKAVCLPSKHEADWFIWQIEHLRVLDAGPDRRARDYGTLRRDLLLHDAI